MSRRDPGPELRDLLINKLTSPSYRPLIKPINANRENILSVVGGGRGIGLTFESSTGNIMPGVVYREVRDGNGSTRIGYVAHRRRNIERFMAMDRAFAKTRKNAGGRMSNRLFARLLTALVRSDGSQAHQERVGRPFRTN